MVSGFFASEDTYAPYLIPLKYISLYKYAFQLVLYNEFKNGNPMTCSNFPDKCDLLEELDFSESFGISYLCAVAVTIAFGIISFILLYKLVKIKL